MTDDLKDVEEVLRAMRERDVPDEALPPADFGAVQRHMRRLQRRRLLLRGVPALAILGLAAGVAAFLLTRNGMGDGNVPVRSAAPQPGARAPAGPPSTPAPVLTRFEPFAGLVAVLEPSTRIGFPSASRVVLTSGGVVLQVKSPTGAAISIETPTARVTVTGTILSVAVEPKGTTVEVLRGRVEVLAAGRTVVLGDRQRLRPAAAAAEPLPAEQIARLTALFPDECAQPAVALAPSTGGASAPGPVVPPALPEAVGRASRPNPPAAGEPHPADASLDELYQQAEAAMRGSRHAEAAGLLRAILGRVAPGSAREETALIDLAQVCERLGDLRGEREALEMYLARHPSGALREDARIDLCRVLERTGPPASLASCVRAYLAEFPNGRKTEWARGILDAGEPDPSRGDGG